MLGFRVEDYEVLQLSQDSRSGFCVIGKSRLTGKTGIAGGRFDLFANSADERYQLRFDIDRKTQELKRILLDRSIGKEVFCHPCRRKKDFLFCRDGVFDLQSFSYLNEEYSHPYLLSKDRLVSNFSYHQKKYACHEIGSSTLTTKDFSFLPIYIHDADDFDGLVSASEILQKRLEAIEAFDFSKIEDLFPFYIALSRFAETSIDRRQMQSVASIADAKRVLKLAAFSHSDVLWNVSLDCPTATKYVSTQELHQLHVKRLHLDVDDCPVSHDELLSVLEAFQLFSINTIEISASGNLHVFSSEFKKPLSFEDYGLAVRGIQIQLFRQGILLDPVSTNPAYFYFFPGIPIIKKSMTSGTVIGNSF